jgi:hypothetical protein
VVLVLVYAITLLRRHPPPDEKAAEVKEDAPG